MKKNIKSKSQIISDFLTLIEEAKSEYALAEEYLDKSHRATQDLLHSIEFENSSRERSKMATQLHTIRLDRRYWKDIFEEAEPILEYYKQHQKAINCLKEVLGKERRVESYHAERAYTPKFFKEAGAAGDAASES